MAATDYTTLVYPHDAYQLPDGTALVPQEVTLTDRDGDGDIGRGDQINGIRITQSYKGDTITVDMGDGPQQVQGVTFYLQNGETHFMSTDGTVLKPGVSTDSTWVTSSMDVPIGDVTPPCFVAGTRIAVPGGWALAGDLQPGDLVTTLDHGAQPILWVGHRTLPGLGASAPVEFAPGALENDRALRVSPQHRVLVRDGRLALLFDTTEALIPACHLVEGRLVRSAPCPEVTYVHFLFACHEIVFSEGTPTESLHPGPVALDGFAAASKAELLRLMPDLVGRDEAYGPCARPVLRQHEAQLTRALVIGDGGFSPPARPSSAPA